MRARLKADSSFASVRACVGREFSKGNWTELPNEFLEEIEKGGFLEIKQEIDKPVEQVEQAKDGLDVVLAGNAATVKNYISTTQDISGLGEMKQIETANKARKSVLGAIDERIVEIETSNA